jgi:hypothetical protein
MSAETKSYDRQEKETIKAYAAFCIYRDMGTDRTIYEVTRQIYRQPTQDIPKIPAGSSRVLAWSAKYKWIDRCKDYDRDREQEVRAILRDVEKDRYIKDLEDYHNEQKLLGVAALKLNRESIESIALLLQPVHRAIKNGTLKKADIELLFASQLAGRNSMGIGSIGRDLAEKGLLLEQVMETIVGEIDSRQTQS